MRISLAFILFLHGLCAGANTGLPTNTLILRYLRCTGCYYLLAIDENRIQLHRLGPAAAIDSLVSDYGKSIREQAANRRTGFKLYRTLLPEMLRLRPRLVICSDGLPGGFPFECLVCDTVASKPAYLVYYAAIIYTQNLRDYLNPDRGAQLSDMRLLSVYPDPQYSGMAPLPFAARESNAICSAYPGKSKQMNTITKSGFLELAPRFDVLHLATHTRSDPNDPERSCILLGAANRVDTVYADELRGLNLRAQLLILSGCESANGLAQAFREAGVRNVLASAWPLPDKCSATIVEDFFRYLCNGTDKARALQLAKLNYLAAADALGAEPHCWAGLKLYGDNNPLSLQAASPKLALVLDSLVCLAAAIGFYMIKKYIPA